MGELVFPTHGIPWFAALGLAILWVLAAGACRPSPPPAPARPPAQESVTAPEIPAPKHPTAITFFDAARPPVVVAPEAMEDQVAFAVADLTNLLARMTGLPVALETGAYAGRAVHVGDVPANRDLQAAARALGRDGFVLDISADAGVRIAGGSKFGAAYGALELLERLGVRWLAPGEWGEVVPRRETLELVPGRFEDRPVFAIRQFHAARVGRPFGEWARHMRHNRCGFGGHSGLVAPRHHGQAHPEWYAEVDGRRRPDATHFKLCHANTGMVAQAVAEVRAALRKRRDNTNEVVHIGYRHRTSDYSTLSISPTDGGGFCRCADCVALGSLSDRLQLFANHVAASIQDEFPGQQIGYYGAYSEHQEPPRVPAHEQVLVLMTSWTKSFFEPLSRPGNRAFREKVAAFSATCPKLAIRDYDGLSVWWGFGPFTLADVHAADYAWYHQHGVQGIITEAHTGWGPWGYSYYLTSKLWWNPSLDLDALKEDYVRSAYGAAAAPMRRYHQRLDDAVVYPSPTVLHAMRQDLEAAATLARRPDVRRRIDFLRAYYLLLDAHNRLQNGQAGAEDAMLALRVLASIDAHVSPLHAGHFLPALDQAPATVEPLSPEALRALLDAVELTKPRDLTPWRDADDAHLQPWPAAGTNWVADMGANYRYGPHVMLIHAKSGERLRVTQQGPSRTEYELTGPEWAVLTQGTAVGEEIVDLTAGSDGIYRLTFSTRGNRPRIQVENRSAVVKAGGALQHLHPMHRAILYFYVPRGTREFAIVAKADEPLYLQVFGPQPDAPPILPRTLQKAKVFMEHVVAVPEGADGSAWRMQLDGEDKKVFLLGIPPLLASHPERLLIPAGETPNHASWPDTRKK